VNLDHLARALSDIHAAADPAVRQQVDIADLIALRTDRFMPAKMERLRRETFDGVDFVACEGHELIEPVHGWVAHGGGRYESIAPPQRVSSFIQSAADDWRILATSLGEPG
jgi:hypothetical protein